MTEMTIAAPLSGEEVIEAIVNDVRRMLVRDCHLNPALAYEAFEGEVTIKLKLKDNGREPELEVEVEVRGGPPGELEKASAAEAFRQLHHLPPNTVRERAGLGIPTVVEDASGRKDVKTVHYAKRTAEDAPKSPESKR